MSLNNATRMKNLAKRIFSIIPLLCLTAGSATATVRYVDVNSASPTPPYTDWGTAARTLQDAVDAALAGDQILVTNGVYQTGGKEFGTMTNRVVVDKAVTIQSVNGPATTQIVGGAESLRCVYLATGATMVGFTLTNGTANSGGGVWCESASVVVSNCVITGNSASHKGGGACSGILINCTLVGNSANIPMYVTNDMGGGGAAFSLLINCTVAGNSAVGAPGGGAFSCTLSNCMVIGNSGRFGGGGVANSTLKNSTLAGNLAGGFGGGACTADSITARWPGTQPVLAKAGAAAGPTGALSTTALPITTRRRAMRITPLPPSTTPAPRRCL